MAGTTRQVCDDVPVLLEGAEIEGNTHISFVQKCCRCGLRHSVRIKKLKGKPDALLTFTQLKDAK